MNALMVFCGLQHLNSTRERSSASLTLLTGTFVTVGWVFCPAHDQETPMKKKKREETCEEENGF